MRGGEGFGVLVIEGLLDAIDDGDTIRAVIRATGSNQDECTPGIAQANNDAQTALIKNIYEKAELDMNYTRTLEAHGEDFLGLRSSLF